MIKSTCLADTPLAEAIGSRGLRRDFVAVEAGLHPSMISHLTSGRRRMTPYYAHRLAPVLGVTPEYLLGIEANQ